MEYHDISLETLVEMRSVMAEFYQEFDEKIKVTSNPIKRESYRNAQIRMLQSTADCEEAIFEKQIKKLFA